MAREAGNSASQGTGAELPEEGVTVTRMQCQAAPHTQAWPPGPSPTVVSPGPEQALGDSIYLPITSEGAAAGIH